MKKDYQVGFREFITRHPPLIKELQIIDEAAQGDKPILITGESGVGKELIAQRIHTRSRRQSGPLIVHNAAALSDETARSELFGHYRGAYTDAKSNRTGLVELAKDGTIIIDEVAELSHRLQVMLLRVAEYGDYIPLGGEEIKYARTRFIFATNKPDGLRDDFNNRCEAEFVIPPLRERPLDLELYIAKSLEELAVDRGLFTISEHAAKMLRSYDWPGNVRELQNVLRMAAVRARVDQRSEITEADIVFRPKASERGVVLPDNLPLDEVDRSYVFLRWKRFGYSDSRTACAMRCNTSTVNRKIRDYLEAELANDGYDHLTTATRLGIDTELLLRRLGSRGLPPNGEMGAPN